MTEITYRMGVATPKPVKAAPISDAESDAFLVDETRSFGELLREHMRRSMTPDKTSWNNTNLGRELDISKTLVRQLLDGRAVAKRTPIETFLAPFGLLGSELQPLTDQRRRQSENFSRAWRQLHAGSRTGASSTDEGAAGGWVFPAALSAPLAERRAELREEISALLEPDAGAFEPHEIGLSLLARHWPEAGLADPSECDENEEPVLLVQSFTRAIIKCNGLSVPWGTKKPEAGVVRRVTCMRIAKLLSALAWTEAAWCELPKIGASKRLQRVVHPDLLLAGVEAARGADFDLPVDTGREGAARRTFDFLSNGAPKGTRHVPVNGLIRSGVGKDNESTLLRLVDQAINPHHPAPDPLADPRAIATMKRSLGSQIRTLKAVYGRSFMVSEEFLDEDDSGIELLFSFADELAALALAHSAAVESPYIRCSEEELVFSIKLCLHHIAEIPD